MDRIADVEAMRSVLQTWQQQQPGLLPPQGRWAIHRIADDAVIGGVAIGLLPPDGEDLEVSWQLNPAEWGKCRRGPPEASGSMSSAPSSIIRGVLMEHEGSVSDDASGVGSGIGGRGQLEQLDGEVAVHGVVQQPAQRVKAAGVGRLECLAAPGGNGGCGCRVAFASLRSVQVVTEVCGDDSDRAGRVEQRGQQGGDRCGWRGPHDDGEHRDR